MSLTLIYRIKSLRQAGIRLIAGESLFGVALRPVLEDETAYLLSAGIQSFGIGDSLVSRCLVYGNGATGHHCSSTLWIDLGRDFYLTKCRLSTWFTGK